MPKLRCNYLLLTAVEGRVVSETGFSGAPGYLRFHVTPKTRAEWQHCYHFGKNLLFPSRRTVVGVSPSKTDEAHEKPCFYRNAGIMNTCQVSSQHRAAGWSRILNDKTEFHDPKSKTR